MKAHWTLSSEGQKPDKFGFVGLWKIVVVKSLPFADIRRVEKVPKFLAHRPFPSARLRCTKSPKQRFRPYEPKVTKNAKETDSRKSRKAQLQRDEAVGKALPIGIAVGAVALAGLYFSSTVHSRATALTQVMHHSITLQISSHLYFAVVLGSQ